MMVPKASVVPVVFATFLMLAGAFIPLTVTSAEKEYKDFKVQKHLWADKGGEAVAWSPDGKYVVSQTASNQQTDFSFKYWKVKDRWQSVEVYTEHEGIIYAFAWSPDSTKLATCFRSLIIVDVNSNWATRDPIAIPGNQIVRTASWHPSDDRIALGTELGMIIIVNSATNKIERTFNASQNWVDRAVWSPDGKYLAVSSVDGLIRIYDGATWAVKWTFTDHTQSVRGLAWSPNSTQLVSVSFDSNIFLWDVKAGKQIRKIGGHGVDISVFDVQWGPKNDFVVSSGAMYICIWQVGSWDLMQKIEKGYGGHDATGTSITWDPAGTRFIVTGSDSIDVWSQNVPVTNDPLTQIYSNICGIVLVVILVGVGGYAGYQVYMRRKIQEEEENEKGGKGKRSKDKDDEEEDEEEEEDEDEEEGSGGEEDEEEDEEPEEDEEDEDDEAPREKSKPQKKKGW